MCHLSMWQVVVLFQASHPLSLQRSTESQHPNSHPAKLDRRSTQLSIFHVVDLVSCRLGPVRQCVLASVMVCRCVCPSRTHQN